MREIRTTSSIHTTSTNIRLRPKINFFRASHQMLRKYFGNDRYCLFHDVKFTKFTNVFCPIGIRLFRLVSNLFNRWRAVVFRVGQKFALKFSYPFVHLISLYKNENFKWESRMAKLFVGFKTKEILNKIVLS